MRTLFYILISAALFIGCQNKHDDFGVKTELDYCVQQANKTIALIPNDSLIPRSISDSKINWDYVGKTDWTSGFWPGILWYIYQYTGNDSFKLKAEMATKELTSDAYMPSFDHDLGFMLYNSFGNGYRLTKNSTYKKVLLAAADSLATLFNPKVGTILSWPSMVKKMNWPHNTIIDNMMNLELLFWAAKNGGGQRLYNIAVTHAETTMKNQFRPDYSNYHVVVYDTTTGQVIKRITHQGYSDSSMWARGQSWAIYGFTMVYRETHEQKFLDFAQKVADVYLQRLPKDLIPYWDFNAPNIPNAPTDASAAAVTASALLELSIYVGDKKTAENYFNKALGMLKELSSAQYQCREKNDAFLLHSTGNMPIQGEIDVPIIYADYYYLEALLRLKEIESGKKYFE
jgi:unsaturated chondroitin disaccharide hydrolase